jgi:hypothetical protein
MKHICQLLPHPKVRACLGYVSIQLFAELLNLKLQVYFTTATTFLKCQLQFIFLHQSKDKNYKNSNYMKQTRWEKALKPATFIHLCNWSSNTNSNSIIFFFKKSNNQRWVFHCLLATHPQLQWSHSKMKLSHLDQSNYLPNQNQGPVTKIRFDCVYQTGSRPHPGLRKFWSFSQSQHSSSGFTGFALIPI